VTSNIIIPPSVGRIVWFNPAPHDGLATLNGHPLAAIVAGVHNDRLVNLAVFDAYGNSQQRSNVQLVQPNEERPNHAHATWMPYQVGQAAKTEVAQAVADVAISAATMAISVAQESASTEPSTIFAETDGTSASETGLVNDQITDSVTQSPAVETSRLEDTGTYNSEAAPSSSEPTPQA
jgi:hypothetical protein